MIKNFVLTICGLPESPSVTWHGTRGVSIANEAWLEFRRTIHPYKLLGNESIRQAKLIQQ